MNHLKMLMNHKQFNFNFKIVSANNNNNNTTKSQSVLSFHSRLLISLKLQMKKEKHYFKYYTSWYHHIKFLIIPSK